MPISNKGFEEICYIGRSIRLYVAQKSYLSKLHQVGIVIEPIESLHQQLMDEKVLMELRGSLCYFTIWQLQ